MTECLSDNKNVAQELRCGKKQFSNFQKLNFQKIKKKVPYVLHIRFLQMGTGLLDFQQGSESAYLNGIFLKK